MSDIKVRYFRRYKKKVVGGGNKVVDVPRPGGLTLATVRDGDMVRFGLSRCMKIDNFDKKEGRVRAIERLAAATTRYNSKTVSHALDEHNALDHEKMNGVISFSDIKQLLDLVRSRV